LEKANPTVVGTLAREGHNTVLIPDDPRLPQTIWVRPGPGEASPRTAAFPASAAAHGPLLGQKAVVSLLPWDSRHHPLEAELLEVLGPADAPGVEMQSILRRFQLPEQFPQAVLEEANRIPESLTSADLRGREDLRQQPVLTIDPDDARDFDDAIHVEPRNDGWLLSVHIADVAHYVKNGTALDREARLRGNSTYLAERVVPMLPERLSNGVCSLKPGVDRLAYSAFLEINAQGKVTATRFARTVIRSIARLTYRQAFAILEKSSPAAFAQLPPVPEGSRCFTDPEVQLRVRTAWKLARLLRKKRFGAGSLDLDFPEIKVRLDAEGRPVALEKIENDISHQLIEECMLAANEAVAAALRRTGIPSVYRIHETPDPERLREFREKAAQNGHRAGDLLHRPEVQRLLAAIKGQPEEYLVKLDFLKSLKRATYDIRPLGHYGLAKDNYTHFTSPIRRYADLLVHRALAGEKGLPAGSLGETAVHISATERKSAEAEKDSVQRKKIAFFEQQLRSRQPQIFHAVVVDIRHHGLQIELPEVLLTGLVPLRALPEDRYWFDAESRTLRGRRSAHRYKLGSTLRVVIARVDAHKGFLDFAPAADPADTPAPPVKARSSREKQKYGRSNKPARPGDRKSTAPKAHAPAHSRHRKTEAALRKKRR
jgi:ribonuclease R